MEYFLLKPFECGCKMKITNDDKDILICQMTEKGDLPDFTMQPVPLISDRFKELLEQFLPAMEFGPCLLEGEGKPDFWTFHPKEYPLDQAEYQPDGSVKAISHTGLMPIFKVSNYKKISYVVNLVLAECLLRRGFVNFTLERVEIMGGE